MKNFQPIIYVLAVFAIILYFDKCRKNGSESGTGDTIVSKIEHIFDTTIHHRERIDIVHHSTGPIFLPAKIDTDAVIKDYFTRYVYSDTLIDSNLAAFITDTVFKNTIMYRSFNYKLLRPVQIINTAIVEEKKNKLFLGAALGHFDNNLFTYASASWIDKKERLYGISYDPFNKTVFLTAQVKFNLFK